MPLKLAMIERLLLKVGPVHGPVPHGGIAHMKKRINRLAIKRQTIFPFVIPAEAGIQGALRLRA